MAELCHSMRLIKLKNLTLLPRNARYSIMLGRESHTIPYRYHVVIPGDPGVFSLTQDKINFLEGLKGFTLAENIKNIKDHGTANMINSWEHMRISPMGNKQASGELSSALGSTNPRAQKIPPQYLSGVQTSDDVIEYQFLACFDDESSRRMRTSLLLAWEKNDMPLRDARPWIHDMDCSVGGLASCNTFYAKQILSMHKNDPYSKKKHASNPAKKRFEINQQKEDEQETYNAQQHREEHESHKEKEQLSSRNQEDNYESRENRKQRLDRDRRLRYNAALLRLNFQ